MKMIKNDRQYQAAIAKVERLLKKGFNNLTIRDVRKLGAMSRTIEFYELIRYPMPIII